METGYATSASFKSFQEKVIDRNIFECIMDDKLGKKQGYYLCSARQVLC
jgi:hypothetical protein